MRLRITTAPPLDPLKSLISVPRILLDDTDSTIRQLKQYFCGVLSCLKTCGPINISISVDGFDVLDFNPLSVLCDGDLLLIKLHANVKAGMKRKREDNAPLFSPPFDQPKKKRKEEMSSSSSSLSSSSSSESESDSSDSSSDSDTNSDISPPIKVSKHEGASTPESSSANSGSESSSSPHISPPNHPKPNQKFNNTPVFTRPSGPNQENAVPPGHGKPSTRKRNARRRLHRLAAAENSRPKDVQPTPVIAASLGDPAKEASPTTIGQKPPAPVVGSSLTNSNKRRGFKQSMQDVVPQKTTFLSPGNIPQTPRTPTLAKKPYTLIPPSQRTDLPRNIVVTSVDVEAGMWGEGVRRETKRKAKPKSETKKNIDDVPDVVLDYSEDGGRTEDAFDWTKAEKGFDGYRAAVREDIVEGRILLWKELALNSTTFCPELMVMAGRVGLMELDKDEVVPLIPIKRPALEDGVEVEVGETIMMPAQDVLNHCRVLT